MNKFLVCAFLTLMIPPSTFASEKAPNFTLKTDNGSITLSKLDNKVIYVDFWATWCTPCRKSFPWMNEMHNKYKKKGLKIIAINLDDNSENAKSFLKKYPVDFTIAYDPEGETADNYKVKVMPSSYLIGKKQKIISTHFGFKNKDKDTLELEFKKALGL